MSKPVLDTRPPTNPETILRDKFAETIVNQSEVMDKLAQQLITLELAIPGLYATFSSLLTVKRRRWPRMAGFMAPLAAGLWRCCSPSSA